MKHFDFGGTGAPLHFLHANGYPPDCYKPLFELLKTEYHVFGMPLRPLWDEAKIDDIKDWQPFSNDLLRFLDKGREDPAPTLWRKEKSWQNELALAKDSMPSSLVANQK